MMAMRRGVLTMFRWIFSRRWLWPAVCISVVAIAAAWLSWSVWLIGWFASVTLGSSCKTDPPGLGCDPRADSPRWESPAEHASTKDDTAWEKLGQDWSDGVAHWLSPLVPPAVGVALVLVGLLVLARLLVFVPIPATASLGARGRFLFAAIGYLTIVYSSVETVLAIASLGTAGAASVYVEGWVAPFLTIVPPLGWGFVGAWALAFSVALRLSATVVVRELSAKPEVVDSGPADATAKKPAEDPKTKPTTPEAAATASDPKADDSAAAVFNAALMELAKVRPGALEIPAPGANVPSLVSSIIAESEIKSEIVKTLRRILLAILGTSPWAVFVEIPASRSTAFITIRRNGRLLSTREVSIAGWPVRSDADEHRLRLRVAAAIATSVFARHHIELDGIGRSSNPTSIAQHFIATSDYRDDPDRAINLLQRAVAADPTNLSAEMALQSLTFRRQSDPALIKVYAQWLRVRLERFDGPLSIDAALDERTARFLRARRFFRIHRAAPTELDLQRRLLLSFLVTQRNMPGGFDDHEGFQVAAETLADMLLEAPWPQAWRGDPSLRDRMRPIAANDLDIADQIGRNTEYQKWNDESRVSLVPEVAYSRASALLRGTPDEEKITEALGRFSAAFASETLFEWAANDPEIEAFRRTDCWKKFYAASRPPRRSWWDLDVFAERERWSKLDEVWQWPAPAPSSAEETATGVESGNPAEFAAVVRRAERTMDPEIAHLFRQEIVAALFGFGIRSMAELREMRPALKYVVRALSARLARDTWPGPDESSINQWLDALVQPDPEFPEPSTQPAPKPNPPSAA